MLLILIIGFNFKFGVKNNKIKGFLKKLNQKIEKKNKKIAWEVEF